MVDKQLILDKVNEYAPELFAFLREIVAIKSYDYEEGDCIRRIKAEMEKVGFEEIEIDPMGNLIGKMGHGSHLIAYDGHCDVVGEGDPATWDFDPFEGFEDDIYIGGRGSTDQKGGIASMIYAAKIIKELDLLGDYTLMVTASVMEENCEGKNWNYIIDQDGYHPEFVVLTEPTSGTIKNGQRGRVEIGITVKGVGCHGSMPERGINAVYKMAPIIEAIKRLNEAMTDDGVLGKGSVAISEISSKSASRCAVAYECTIALDRRTNSVESTEYVLEQLRELPEVKAAGGEVFLFTDAIPSWTGMVFPIDLTFPSWIIDPDAAVCRGVSESMELLFGKKPRIEPWVASTNGVAIMGNHEIPCIGFGPGLDVYCHTSNEKTTKQELLECCAIYALLPEMYMKAKENR